MWLLPIWVQARGSVDELLSALPAYAQGWATANDKGYAMQVVKVSMLAASYSRCRVTRELVHQSLSTHILGDR